VVTTRPAGQREVPEVVGGERQLVAVPGLAPSGAVEQHTGVAHERVEAIELEPLHRGLDRGRLGQIEGQVPHPRIGHAGADRGEGGGGSGGVPAAEDHEGTGAGELFGDEVADARVTSGDQDVLVVGRREPADVPAPPASGG
jgi:hypothetical protein